LEEESALRKKLFSGRGNRFWRKKPVSEGRNPFLEREAILESAASDLY
jgi:hypothetical protein